MLAELGRSLPGLALVAALVAPQLAAAQVVADGYALEENCPNIVVGGGGLGVPADWNVGQMALSNDGTLLYLTYLDDGFGQVHVRDLHACTEQVLIPNMDTPLGIAVHPHTGELYISHRYLNPAYVVGDPIYTKYRSAVSIYSPSGELLVDKWVRGFAPSIFSGVPASGEVGNGLQGLNFDPAGNLYMVCNVDVWEPVSSPPDFYATGPLYKVSPDGEISVFATGLRASFEAVVAKVDRNGEATAFYAGDNGEGNFCSAAGNGCAPRVVPGSTPTRAITRMYYDELNYVVKGAHYGYPESAPTVPFDPAQSVTHIGPLWNFERGLTPTALWPVPTGLALLEGRFGKVRNPLFLTFYNARRLDMFSGPNLTDRVTLVSELPGRGSDVVTCTAGEVKVLFREDTTRKIWRIRAE
jgi:hypothetical protein